MNIFIFQLLIGIYSSWNFRTNMAAKNPPPRHPHHINDDKTKQMGFDMALFTEPGRRESNYDFECALCLGLARDLINIGRRHVMLSSCLGKLKHNEQRKKMCFQSRVEIHFTQNYIGNVG